jgi:hypothetical protein
MMNRAIATTVVLLLSAALVQAADDVKVVVGPNYLVSHDGDVPHCEMMIAANPLDARNLVAMSIVAARPNGGWACRTYATRDGGGTWRYSDFAEQTEYGGGDPQVVFTPNGTAIALSLAFGSVKDDTGKPRGGMAIYRSEDGGFTWKMSRNICCSHDHPQMIVDNSLGKYAGRVYIGVLWDYPVYRVGIFRSDDDGRSWIGPVEAVNGGGEIGVNVTTTGVLSDGTLVVPYVDFEYKPEKAKVHGKVSDNAWLVKSSDGGLTFGKPIRTQTITFDIDMREAFAVPQTAIDARSEQFRDNMYMTWIDTTDKPRVVFSRSKDRGETWTKPAMIAADVPAATWQIQPSITVNNRGVVGITWLDTRGVTDHSKYDLYFAASTDGGQTFMKPVKITTDPSIIAGNGNSRPMGSIYPIGESGNLSLLSAANRWPNGGDYFSIATTSTGVFYPVWADARTGTFQVYTAPVRVDLPATEAEKTRAAARAVYDPPKPPPDPAKRVETSILNKVEIVFDPGTWDNNISELPLRLKNTSDVDIYPPIKVEITDFGMAVEKRDKAYDPSILNASNGKPGAGAIFSFDQSLGGDGVLHPGMLSGPVPVRLKVPDPKLAPSLQFKITGFVNP